MQITDFGALGLVARGGGGQRMLGGGEGDCRV